MGKYIMEVASKAFVYEKVTYINLILGFNLIFQLKIK